MLVREFFKKILLIKQISLYKETVDESDDLTDYSDQTIFLF